MNHSKRILIIDDDERNRSLLEAMLRSLEYQTECASDGPRGLEKLNSSFDLVLLDVLMPGIDGYEVTRRIRNRSDCGDIPVVMVTALTGKEDRLKAVAAGANDFISKPIDRMELQVRVASLLKMRESQNALRRSEEKYRALVETVRDTIWTVDLDLRFTYVSPAVTQVLGYTVEEVMSTHPLDGLTPESRQRIINALQEEMASEAAGHRDTHRSRTEEIERYHKDGSTRWSEIRTTFLRDGAGKPVGILGISHDITQRKRMEEALRQAQDNLERRVKTRTADLVKANAKLRKEIRERERAEKALRESEQRLDLALKGADLGLWDWNVTTGSVVINRRAEEMLGYEPGEIEPCISNWEKLLHPDDRAGALGTLNEHLQNRTDSYEAEYRLSTRQRNWKWILSRGMVVERDPDGKPLRMTGTFLDITIRKQSEESLGESEERYRTLFENISNGVAIYEAVNEGEDFTIVDFNRAAEMITGMPRDRAVGKRVTEAFPSIKEFGLFDVLKATWQTGQPAHHPIKEYRDAHLEVWTENLVCKLPSGEVVAVFSDDTERRRAELALQESEKKYRLLVDKAPVGVLSVDRNGRILEVNRKLLEILGSPSADATKSINMLSFPPLVDAGLADVFSRCMETGALIEAQLPYTSKWGKTLYLRYS